MLRRIYLIWMMVAGLTAVPTAAFALVSQIPVVGSDISLSFSYQINLATSQFELRDHRNRLIDCADAKQGPSEGEVIVSTRDRLAPGSYTLRWRTPTVDGDAEEGSVSLEVGQ